MKRWLSRVITVFLWFMLLGGGLAVLDAYIFLRTPASDKAQEILFTIEPGATFDRVAWDLKKAGALRDVFRFRIMAYLQNAFGKIRAGEYLVNTGWTPAQTLWQITQGQAVLYRLFLPEGLTWWQVAKIVEENGFARYEDFRAVIHDPEFLRKHNIPFANAEGFLYPETYLLQKPRSTLDWEQARQVADILVDAFWKKNYEIWKDLPSKENLRPEACPEKRPAQSRAMSSGAWLDSPNANSGQYPASENSTASKGNAKKSTFLQQTTGATEANTNATDNRLPKEAATENIRRAQTTDSAFAPPPPEHATPPSVSSTPAHGTANATSPVKAVTTVAEKNALQSPTQIDPDALRRLMILASLVEKETAVPEERARVAGVYVNRLRISMLLQCDPTIIYGIGESFTGNIRRSQIDDPKNSYNTYQHAGLPPGPICSPGLAALQAASAPESHGYFYFVATGTDGSHVFSKTITEHSNAVRAYRARLRWSNK